MKKPSILKVRKILYVIAALPVQAPNQVRNNHQPQSSKGARPHRAAGSARGGRRGDRVKRREFITLLGGGQQRGKA